MDPISTAQAAADLGVMVVITGASIAGALVIFKRMIQAFDNLAPAIDRQTTMIREQARNEQELNKQARLLQEEVEQLRHSLSKHDQNACEINANMQKTLERLDTVSAQLENCLSRLGGTKNGNG